MRGAPDNRSKPFIGSGRSASHRSRQAPVAAIQLVVVARQKQAGRMKSVTLTRTILGSAGLVGLIVALALGSQVGPAQADGTDPIFKPLVPNPSFKLNPPTMISEPRGNPSFSEWEKRILVGHLILLSLQSPSPDERDEQCACGNYLIWEEFGNEVVKTQLTRITRYF